MSLLPVKMDINEGTARALIRLGLDEAEAKSERAMNISCPKELTTDRMSTLLYETGGLVIQVGWLTSLRCKHVLEALMWFVGNNPPSVAANLFKSDQLSNVNPYRVLSPYPSTGRNWQYIFALINHHFDQPTWLNGNELLRVASQKSNAVTAGDLMARPDDQTEREHYVALTIAFWIAKLYSVSVYRANPKDLPEPIAAAYRKFIGWKGTKWNSKKPSLRFEDNSLWTREEIMSWFPFAKEWKPSPRSKNFEDLRMTTALEDNDEVFYTMANFLGEDRLLTYCTGFKGSLMDFYLQVFNLGGQGSKSVYLKASKLMSHFGTFIQLPRFGNASEQRGSNIWDASLGVTKDGKKFFQPINQKSYDTLIAFLKEYKKTEKKDSEWKIPARKL